MWWVVRAFLSRFFALLRISSGVIWRMQLNLFPQVGCPAQGEQFRFLWIILLVSRPVWEYGRVGPNSASVGVSYECPRWVKSESVPIRSCAC